jgi:hypothetical protein
MGGRSMDVDWQAYLDRWLAPFFAALRHKTRARMCPAYIAGLIGPGDRESVQPMAARASEVGYDQLHHFVAAGVWDSAPLEAALLKEADALVGDAAGFLVIDDTALPKNGRHSVGVAPQYASSLGKTANCQSLVSVTLAISTACSIIECSACRATRSGSSANAGRLESKNTMCRTYQPMRASRCSPPRSKPDGFVSRRISSSRRNSASTTSKVDPGPGYIDTP